jgi:hypothetical protein
MQITIEPYLWKYIIWAGIIFGIIFVVILVMKLKLFEKVMSMIKKI